jgi:hypothetical protein
MIKKVPYSATAQSLPLTNDEIEPPIVFYSIEAKQTIDHIVASTNYEAAWFGLVEELAEGEFLVYKIYIPHQTVTSASVDVESDAVARVVNEVLDENEDPAKLRYHGHSHVNMDVEPSSVDQEHMLDYIQEADWFIRGIYNKKGASRVDVFDKRVQLAHQKVETEIYEFAQTDEWYHKLDAVIKSHINKRVYTPYTAAKRSAPWPNPKYNNRFDDEEEESYLKMLSDPFFVR